MNAKSLLLLFRWLVLGLACFPLIGRAALLSPEHQVARLHALVNLSADQQARAMEVLRQQNVALQALGSPPPALKRFEIVQETMGQVRALLTPAQQHVYDRTPQAEGGRMNMVTPASEVARLDELVKLTPGQRTIALQVFEEKFESLVGLLPLERPEKGMESRQATRALIRATLTPEQRKIYDITPQLRGGGALANPDSMVERLDQVVALTAAQKTQATEILWDDFKAQIAALAPDEAPHGFRWTQGVRDRLRALLTPAQQAKFDVTPPYRSSGRK